MFIYVLQACHNSLAFWVPLPLCTLNSHVVTLNSREFTLLRKCSMFQNRCGLSVVRHQPKGLERSGWECNLQTTEGSPKFQLNVSYTPMLEDGEEGRDEEKKQRWGGEDTTFMPYSAEIWEKKFRIRNGLWQGIFLSGVGLLGYRGIYWQENFWQLMDRWIPSWKR